MALPENDDDIRKTFGNARMVQQNVGATIVLVLAEFRPSQTPLSPFTAWGKAYAPGAGAF
jgi:hypothetical protein